MPEYDDTRIPAPRVSIIDPRTGLMSREWFRFFVNLYNLADAVGSDDELTQLKLAPSSSMLESYQAVVEQQIQGLEIAPIPQEHTPQRRYGTFYDTTTQTAAAINTAYAVSFNTTDLSNGVTRGTPTSRIYVDRPGVYNFQFSLQLGSTNASTKNVFIWADINGTSVPDSATKITLKGSGEYYVAAWNFVYRLNAGDYFRLMWSTTDTTVEIQYTAATAPAPAIPSVIMTVTDNIGD